MLMVVMLFWIEGFEKEFIQTRILLIYISKAITLKYLSIGHLFVHPKT